MGKRLEKDRGLAQLRVYYPDVLSREVKQNGTMTATNGYGSSYTVAEMAAGNIQIKGAGNSTWGEPKKPFNLTLCDSAYKKKLVNFLGMQPGSTYRFLADYYDVSMCATLLAMDFAEDFEDSALEVLGAEVSPKEWVPDCRKCELWINDQYQGVYTIIEKVERDVSRVNIAKTDFLIERQALSQMSEAEGKFQDQVSGWWHSFKEPEFVAADVAKMAPAKARMEAMSDAIFNGPVNGYKNVVHYPTWWKYGMTQNQIFNPDGFENSLYYTLRMNEPRMRLNPFWDADVAFGIAGRVGWAGLDLDYSNPNQSYLPAKNPMYTKLFQDPVFEQGFKTLFLAALPRMHKTMAQFTRFTDELEASGAPGRNFIKWPVADYRERVTLITNFMRQHIYWLTRRLYDIIPAKAVN